MDLKQTYLLPAKKVKAVNPTHQTVVTKYCLAHRQVDFHVDAAARLEDYDNFGKEHSKHLAQEEKWFDVAQELESDLPKRELENIWKQLPILVNSEWEAQAASAV
jgi:DNA-binding transcriptional regulator GbsR (MarR family)